jgi:hypothetical protein
MTIGMIFRRSSVFARKCHEPWAVFSPEEIKEAMGSSSDLNKRVVDGIAFELSKTTKLCCGIESFSKQGKEPEAVYLVISHTNERYMVARRHAREEFLRKHGGNVTGDELARRT